MENLDLLLIHPGSGRAYGELPDDLVAVEPPLWCRLIAGYVADKGFSTKIIDAEAERLDPTKVALEVFGRQPRLVCIVAYGHQPSASTQQMQSVYEIAKQVRSVCFAKIIVVGGHVSALPEQTLRECEWIDYVCVGEGPNTVVDLLYGGWMRSEISGLAYRDGKGVVINKRYPLLSPDELHGDQWHRLPMNKYAAHNWQCLDDLTARRPYASIYTSLGCPYACSFCCINAPFGGRTYRMRSPEAVYNEIVDLYDAYRVKTFKITDEMFVLNTQHYGAICERLANWNKNDDLNIWAYARVDTVRADNLALLRRAGIRWLALGIESESAYVRDGVDKRLKREDIAEVVKGIQDAGINVIANYIFGLPDDDLDSMRRTLAMAMEMRTEWANFYSAMAYPGSSLYTDAITKGWKLPETWDGYSQYGYETRPLDTRKIDAASVLSFRDEAFNIYFSSPRFVDDTRKKFGNAAAVHVRDMTQAPLARRLLENTYAPKERASAQ